MSVDREADVDQGDEGSHDIADMDSLGVEALRDFQGGGGDHLLPAQASVHAEYHDRGDVEKAPAQGLEDLELHTVDVAHILSFAALIVHPEEVQPQLQKGLEVDEIRRRAKRERMRLAKAELEEMDSHEGEE